MKENLSERTGYPTKMRNLMRFARRALYWSLPPLILYIIFTRIDLGRLELLASEADLFMILLGVLLVVLGVAVGALRWHALLHRYGCGPLPIATSIGEYWRSLAVGVLVPGSLGSDAYRVMILGRRKGFYLRSAFVIGVEKIAALFSCAFLIASLYPLLAPNQLPSKLAQVIDALYVIFLAGIAFAVFIALVRRQDWTRRLAVAINARLQTMAHRIASFAPTPLAQEEKSPDTALALMLSAFSPSVALPTVGLSLTILLISAIQSQLFFQGLGYDLPFSINLFVTPLLFLLFTLPISFGGIGIREGASILLYGSFGVPAEMALVVSFCSLLSMVFSCAIGAGLLLMRKNRLGIDGSQDGPLTWQSHIGVVGSTNSNSKK